MKRGFVAAVADLHQDSCNNWNTPYAWKDDSYSYNEPLSGDNHPEACDISTYYLDYHIWAAVVNVGVTIIFSIVFAFVGLGNTLDSLKMPAATERFCADEELTLETIHEIMNVEGSREPIRDPIGVTCMVIAMLLTTFSLPWCKCCNTDTVHSI
jgi:hypothetical protein